jgi:surface carbohydrate biosynthesis protein
MKSKKAQLLIPVEHQVRELDPKLLLACVAAKRGFSSVIGPRREMHFHLPSFSRSIYLSKSMTSGSNNVFRILRRLGHEVVVWDEEALVHLPPEPYFNRRLSPIALQYVSRMLAWGQDNVELWRQYPDLPPGIPIEITGNPRGDLLRPEMRALYDNDVEKLRQEYGDFILINTNFNQVNAFFPDMNMIKPPANAGEVPELTRRALGMGMSAEEAVGFCNYKQAIFEDFQRLIPALDKAFPDYTIVVRPHPVENQEIYHQIAAHCEHVRVTNEGNVVPWIIAARAMIHNGCTTGVEAYALDVPAITYRATANDAYDRAWHHLPNLLSLQCFSLEEVQTTLGKILDGEMSAADGDERRKIFDHYLAAKEGTLACDRMIDVLESMVKDWAQRSLPTFRDRLQGRIWATRRRFKKRLRGYFPNMSHNRSGYLKHRYPPISFDDLSARVLKFQEVLGYSGKLNLEQIAAQFFRISA